MTGPKCRICGTGLQTGLAYWPDPLLPGDIPNADELCSKCLTLMDRAVNAALDTLREILLLAAADIPPITVRTWFPAPPENRLLPMPLEYA